MKIHKRRGYILLETILAFIFTVSFIGTIVYIPIELFSTQQEFNNYQNFINDAVVLETAIMKDLNKEGYITYQDSNNFKIGNTQYTIQDKSIIRKSNNLTSKFVFYDIKANKINNNLIITIGSETKTYELVYNVKYSSFKKDGLI